MVLGKTISYLELSWSWSNVGLGWLEFVLNWFKCWSWLSWVVADLVKLICWQLEFLCWSCGLSWTVEFLRVGISLFELVECWKSWSCSLYSCKLEYSQNYEFFKRPKSIQMRNTKDFHIFVYHLFVSWKDTNFFKILNFLKECVWGTYLFKYL